MIDKRELVTARGVHEADLNFIMATFLRGLYYGDSWFSQMPKAIFMNKYHEIITNLLLNPNTEVTVACLKEDPEVILAYTIASKDGSILHWAFCKKPWRSIGIVKDLVSKDLKQVTHLTKVGLSIIKKHESLIFNPFAV